MTAHSRLLLQSEIIREVPRSYFSQETKPNCLAGWVRKAASEIHLEGARLLLIERLGFRCERGLFWDDFGARDWRRWDTWERLKYLREAIDIEIAEAMQEAIELVEYVPVSTIGD